jgi:hypothetical protein
VHGHLNAARNITNKDSFVITEVPQWVMSDYLKNLQSCSCIWQISDLASTLMPPTKRTKNGMCRSHPEKQLVRLKDGFTQYCGQDTKISTLTETNPPCMPVTYATSCWEDLLSLKYGSANCNTHTFLYLFCLSVCSCIKIYMYITIRLF